MIDPKVALRSLLKSPVVTAVAVLSLALGIGANAAIFTLFEQLLLRPLPVEEPDRLVNVRAPGPKSGSVSASSTGDSDSVLSYPMFRDLQEHTGPGLTGLAGHRDFFANLAAGGETTSGQGLFVSGNYFEVLGLQPATGRLLQGDDDLRPGGHPVAVLSHALWTKRFAARETVVGERLTVNGTPLTVVGVAPQGFQGITLGTLPEIFVPLSMRETLIPGWKGLDNRRSYWVYAFGRLASDTSLETAQAAMNGPYQRIVREVEMPLQEAMSETILAQFAEKSLVLEEGRRGQSSLHGTIRPALLMLFGVTSLVLLIACANLANLLLIRAGRRSGEIAVRLSVGAQRHQVIAQLLTESFLLAGAGVVAALGVAQMTLASLASLLAHPDGIVFELGPSTWVFVGVLGVVVGLVGLYPAVHATRDDYVSSLKAQGGRNASSRSANRFRTVMATFQIALSMTLLVSAGLLVKSLANVGRVDLGIEVEGLLSFSLSPDLNGYEPEKSREFFARVEREVEALPGVEKVVASMVPLLTNNSWGAGVTVQGFEADLDTDVTARYNEVGPGFFTTLGIPILAGRDLEEQDVAGRGKVAVVNQSFAEKFELGREVLGKWMKIGTGDGELDIQIVGLVADAKYNDVKEETPPMYALPYRQTEEIGTLSFYVRTAGDPKALAPTIRSTVSALDPNLPVDDLETMVATVEENVSLDRMLSILAGAFAVLATLLAAIGLYGVLAYTVVQRYREIGVRMALGADAYRVRFWVLRQVLAMVVVGGVIGAVVAVAFGRVGESLLFELDGTDPVVFALATIVLVLVAFGAGFVPAYRASRTDPIRALRAE